MTPVIAVLATLDTKAAEAAFLADQLRAQGCRPLLIDMGVVGEAGLPADHDRQAVARAGGRPLDELLAAPSREEASPVMVDGAAALLDQALAADQLHGVLGLGGTQGTSSCTAVMRRLPYGLPKVMLSTVASGDTAPFVDIKDITMMPSVGDLLGLNPITRRMLANAAGAVAGMARVDEPMTPARGDRPVVGLTNLGVLTEGALTAIRLLEERGYEAIVFHAVGSGGRAMEQMMRDGLIGAVLDYAMGEISDHLFDGLRSGGPERMTVAAELGLPQVVCPGGAEHVGLLVPANTVPPAWEGHLHVFHSPIILAPRLSAEQLAEVGRDVGRRLAATRGRAAMVLPEGGTSRYGIPGGPLHDPAGDAAFLESLEAHCPATVRCLRSPAAAEDEAFVRLAVDTLVDLIENG